MPKTPRFTPKPRRIEVLAFPDVQLLDVAGPLQVFATANDLARMAGRPALYEPVAVADGALTLSSAGLGLATQPLPSPRAAVDTLIVAGGWGVHPACLDKKLVGWIKARAKNARRVASVCSGAFLLADRGPARRPARRHALEPLRRVRQRFPKVQARARPDLRPGRQGVDVGRRHRRHRSRAGAGGGGSRPRACAGRGAPAGGVPEAAGRPGAIQRRARPAARQRPVRTPACLDRGSSDRRSFGRRARRRQRHERAQLRRATIARRPARRRRARSNSCGSRPRAARWRAACRSSAPRSAAASARRRPCAAASCGTSAHRRRPIGSASLSPRSRRPAPRESPRAGTARTERR